MPKKFKNNRKNNNSNKNSEPKKTNAIEVEGKEPKPKVLAHIMEEAKEEGVKAIFTQPELSDKSAKKIADALKINVIKASPLDPKWDESFIALAKAIANK